MADQGGSRLVELDGMEIDLEEMPQNGAEESLEEAQYGALEDVEDVGVMKQHRSVVHTLYTRSTRFQSRGKPADGPSKKFAQRLERERISPSDGAFGMYGKSTNT